MIPILIFVLVTFAAGVFWSGVGVSVFKLPAGRGVLVAGAGVSVRVGVLDGVKVAVGVAVGVSVAVLVAVGVGVCVGVLLGVRVGSTAKVGSTTTSCCGWQAASSKKVRPISMAQNFFETITTPCIPE